MRALLTAVVVGALLAGTAGCSGGGEPDASPTRPASAAGAPGAVDRLVARGLEQVASGRADDARASFRSALDLAPDNPYARYNLGYLAQAAGDSAEAAQWYADLLATSPDFAPAIYNLAILTEPQDLDAAVLLYRRVLRVDPENAAAHLRLGFALRHLGRRTEGRQHLTAGVRLDPALVGVHPPRYG